jgi:hypothetical protein
MPTLSAGRWPGWICWWVVWLALRGGCGGGRAGRPRVPGSALPRAAPPAAHHQRPPTSEPPPPAAPALEPSAWRTAWAAGAKKASTRASTAGA